MQSKSFPTAVITLTTDFGAADTYVASMKGIILSINPKANIIDVTHEIGAWDIAEAARVLEDFYCYFPKSTIHIAVIDPGVGSDRRPLAIEADDHFFVGPDNGIFWPIIQRNPKARVYHLTNSSYFLKDLSSTFHGRDIFAPVAGHLSMGVSLSTMGVTIFDPLSLVLKKAVILNNEIKGQVIKIDHFGNIITNIKKEDLMSFLKEGDIPFIEIGNLTVKKISNTYSDVPLNAPATLIGSSGYLEIAANMGRACDMTGLSKDSLIGATCRLRKIC